MLAGYHCLLLQSQVSRYIDMEYQLLVAIEFLDLYRSDLPLMMILLASSVRLTKESHQSVKVLSTNMLLESGQGFNFPEVIHIIFSP